MEKEKRVFPMNALHLCIDHCEEDLKGRAYSKLSNEELSFENFGEFLLKAENLFDECGYPQSFEEKRNFSTKRQLGCYRMPEAQMQDEEILGHKGKIYTADIFVKSRRRAGWQGYLIETDWAQKAEYLSEMELLHLICSALGWKYTKKE